MSKPNFIVLLLNSSNEQRLNKITINVII